MKSRFTLQQYRGPGSGLHQRGQAVDGCSESGQGLQRSHNGLPSTSGPLGPQGPTSTEFPSTLFSVNPVSTPPKESRVMNDAILQAARDLSKRDRTRRKIIFIISDGREQVRSPATRHFESSAHQNITVYAVGVEGAPSPSTTSWSASTCPRHGRPSATATFCLNTSAPQVAAPFTMNCRRPISSAPTPTPSRSPQSIHPRVFP